MPNNTELRIAIQTGLQAFESPPLRDASLALLKILGYQSDKAITVKKSDPEAFLALLAEHNPDVKINKEKALFNDWKKADILFQLTDEELSKERTSLRESTANTQLLQSYLFFAIELNQQNYARGNLISIARQLNRVFPMPVMVLIKHGKLLSIAVINRRQNKKDSEKDVLGKATIIRDISLIEPHTGHIQILSTFALQNLSGINSFDALHAAWEEVLNVEILNKKFYNELSNWYFWAINEVSFPGEQTRQSFFEDTGSTDENKLREAKQQHNAKNVIRLLTRFLFVWFIKEKKLIPNELFDPEYLQKEILKDLSPYHEDGLFKSVNIQSHYYKAILQNLFFATLNQEMGKRAFRRSGQNRNVTNLLRYENCFKHPKKFIELAEKYTPFMNGGLFECLDKPHPTKKGRKGGDVIIHEDGFSDRTDNPLKVPDYLFFGHDENVDLSEQYGSKAKKYKQAAVKGLINIFKSYKFTITENTPIDQEIALDPELLGKVFENLLASYNPETKTTARKQTGSFYTPREIVGYMVDESLIAYLKNEVDGWDLDEAELDKNLHELLSYNDNNPFENNSSLQKKIIQALDRCKILDPACGSGAFPMGILQKMVHILQKVDPNNSYWQDLQMENAVRESERVFHIDNKEAREQKLIEINEAFDQQVNDPDYARKLFLIENCIYGVDIQPIATQISKLRFFISLVVDQKVDKNKTNFGVRPLPNLETKFVAANTLIGIDNQDGQMTLDNPDIKKLESELIEIRHRIFSAKTPPTKRKYREEDKLVREKMGHLLIEDGWASKMANQLAGWDPYDQNVSSEFFDPEWMFGIMDGFDVVIGNPPYLKERDNAHYFGPVNNSSFGKKWHQGKMDFWFYFLHKSIDLSKSEICFITSRYWLNSQGAKKLITRVNDELSFVNVVDIGKLKVFDAVAGHHMVSHFSKKPQEEFKYIKLSDDISAIEHGLSSKSIEVHMLKNSIVFTESNEIVLSNDYFSELNGIELLGKLFNVSQGVVEAPDKISKKQFQSSSRSDIYVGRGVFVLNESEVNQIDLSSEARTILKLYVDPNNVSSYHIDYSGLKYLIYSDKKIKEEIRTNTELSKIKGHLDSFAEFITSSNKPYGIHRARKSEYFERPKIIFKNMFLYPDFAYDDKKLYFGFSFSSIIQKDSSYSLKYLLTLLNSSFAKKWFYTFGKQRGVGVDIGVEKLRLFPVKILTEDSQAIFIQLSNIASSAKLTSDASFNAICGVIDGLVFQLYFFEHMQEKQIDILKFVEKDLVEVMQEQDFEKLPDSKKENIINQLHARWTHPDSEVRNRIKLFAVRSPDILKPILESR